MANIKYHHGVTIKNTTDVSPRIKLRSDIVIAVFGTATKFVTKKGNKQNFLLIENEDDLKNITGGSLETAIKAIYAQAECTIIAIKTASAPTNTDLTEVYKIRSIYGLDPNVIIAPKFLASKPEVKISLVDFLKETAPDPAIKAAIEEKIAEIDAEEISLKEKKDKLISFIAEAIEKETNNGKKSKLTAYKDKVVALSLPNSVSENVSTYLSKFQAVCEKIEAIGFYDCEENEISKDNSASSIKFENDDKIPRIMPCYPLVKPSKDEIIGMSAYAAGALAKTDLTKGFWSSPSNSALYGIKELFKNISYHESDLDCEANLLNKNQITTIIRDDQWRLWGNQTLHKKDGEKHNFYKFLSVVRTQDVINKSIRKGIAQLVDAGISRNLVEMATAMIDQFLSKLQTMGALVNFSIKPDEKFNTPENISNGKIKFYIDWTPIYVAENIRFEIAITNKYIGEVFE